MRPGPGAWARLFVQILALGGLLASGPRGAWGQAEPAPASYVRPGGRREPPAAPLERPWHLAVAPRLSLRLGSGPAGIPVVGYGGGVRLGRALVPLRRLRFGVALAFAYDRFARDKAVTIPFGDQTQLLSHMSFAALAVLDGWFGRLRPWLALGAGLSVASYADPPVAAGAASDRQSAVLPLVQVALGLGVRVWRSLDLGLHAEGDFTFSSRSSGTPPRPVFQPGLIALALDLGFGF